MCSFAYMLNTGLFFDFESNSKPSILSENVKYVSSRSTKEISEYIDVYFDINKKSFNFFIDSPDIYFTDKYKDLSNVLNKGIDRNNVVFFIVLNTLSYSTLSEEDNKVKDSYINISNKLGLNPEDISLFETISAKGNDVKFKILNYSENSYNLSNVKMLLRDYKINKILNG